MERATSTVYSRGLSDEEDDNEDSPMKFDELEEESSLSGEDTEEEEQRYEEKFGFSE